MTYRFHRIRTVITAFVILITLGISAAAYTVPCAAAEEKKADISAVSGFGKNYTMDDKGKFEIEGVMVTNGSIYNITVDGDNLQAWCGKYRGRTWGGQQLTDLLNDPTTVFYEKAEGTKDSAEFTNKVEFARPNGKSY